jgi:hypothetical protein
MPIAKKFAYTMAPLQVSTIPIMSVTDSMKIQPQDYQAILVPRPDQYDGFRRASSGKAPRHAKYD